MLRHPQPGADFGWITLDTAALMMPGGKTTRGTVHRWCQEGRRFGNRVVSMDFVLSGRRIYTKREWVQKFIRECTEAWHAQQRTGGTR